jgi:arginyl-tRNA synthetase
MEAAKAKIANLALDFFADAAEFDEEAIAALVKPPKDDKLGDLALPCFPFAKSLKKSPNEIAAEFAEKFSAEAGKDGLFSEARATGSYVNFFVRREMFFAEAVGKLANGDSAAENERKENADKTVLVEFSSPNIAKPFHIGHIRSTVIGSALANIYAALGYNVVRLNYLGDYGTQFGKIIVAYRKWGKREEVEEKPIESLLAYYKRFHDEAKSEPGLEDEARKAFSNLEGGAAEELKLWEWFREESLREFKRVYDLLGIDFDDWLSESKYTNKLEAVSEELEKKELLKDSDGAKVVDLGLDENGKSKMPALIKKKDGSSLYITRDIASAIERWEDYHFDKSLYVVAANQSLHFEQWFEVIRLMGYEFADKMRHIPFGLVRLEGKVMATREGEVVYLEDVLLGSIEKTREIIREKGVASELEDEIARKVGIGAVVFNELSQDRIRDYVFSWEKVLNFEGETGPYVQYAHARLAGVLRKSEMSEEEILTEAAADNNKAEGAFGDDAFAAIKAATSLGGAVKRAAEANEPAVVTRKILEIAKAANRFYHGNRILSEDKPERLRNLALVILCKRALAEGLGLIGLAAPEKM